MSGKVSSPMNFFVGSSAFCFFTLLVSALLVLLLGIFSGKQDALGPNPCKMTYSSVSKKIVTVKSKNRVSGSRLYQYNSNSLQSLNAQPVLFIPGHKGEVDQVRSFSSAEHNGDNAFQYFALDFKGANSAFHGSDILTQAVFANDALRTIQDLYQAAFPTQKAPKIIILAHSIGGMVARTTALLSNHPATWSTEDRGSVGFQLPAVECAVSDIIMLSSPNNRGPYSPDASVDVLYGAVNRAWAGSLYPTSQHCRETDPSSMSIKKRTQVQNTLSDTVNGVTAEWHCPPCAAKIRLVSITGGSLDSLIPPTMTRLDSLAPVPRNITKERTPPPSMLSVLTPVLTAPMAVISAGVRMVVRTGGALFSSRNVTATDSSTNNSSSISIGNSGVDPKTAGARTGEGDVRAESESESENGSASHADDLSSQITVDVDVDVNGDTILLPPTPPPTPLTDDKCEIAGTCPAKAVTPQQLADALEKIIPQESSLSSGKDVKRPAASVTEEDWSHMQSYTEPLHLSLHTSQLSGVHFPIDHNAMLWCKQFVSFLSSRMKLLSGVNSTEGPLDLRKVFLDISDQKEGGGTSVGGSGGEGEGSVGFGEIPAVAALSARDSSRSSWRVAQQQDRVHVLRRCTLGVPQLMAFEFITSHVFKIFACYILLCLLCMCYPIMAALTNNTRTTSSSSSCSCSAWSLMNPWKHSHLQILSPALDAVVLTMLPPTLSHLITPDRPLLLSLLSLSFILILPKMLYDYFTQPLVFASSYSPALYWIVSYGIALGIRAVLLASLSLFHWLTSSIWSILRAVLRATFWCRAIRRPAKSALKTCTKFLSKQCGVPSYLLTGGGVWNLILGSAVCVGLTIGTRQAWGRISGEGAMYSLSTLFISLTSVSLAALAVVAVLIGVLMRSDSAVGTEPGAVLGVGAVGDYDHNLQLVLLMMPLPLLTSSTAYFSYTLLFLPHRRFLAALPLFEIFGPDRLTYCVCLGVVVVHLFMSRRSGYFPLKKVQPIAWLVELLGPSSSAADLDDFFLKSSRRSGGRTGSRGGTGLGSGSKGVCVHEEGGRYAIFESNNGDPDSTEWCEFCTCRKCGGKNLPPVMSSRSPGVNEDGVAYPDSSAELLMLVGVLGCVVGVLFYAGDRPYRYLHVMGALCSLYVLKDVHDAFASWLS